MRVSDIILNDGKDYRPKPIARLWGGLSGRTVPDDLKKFMAKHIKSTSNGNQYVNQYPDQWYFNIFTNSPEINDFNSFFAIIKPYFTVQRIQEL